MGENYMDILGMLAGIGIALYVIALAVSIFTIVCTWKCYVKMGEPGWASLIPFYSNYVLCKNVFGNGWLFLLLFVPLVGQIFLLVMYFKWFKGFEKSGLFAAIVGLFFMPVALAICAFDSSSYIGG